MRLNIAKDFLLVGKYKTVKETCYAVGFKDADYFSERFQQRFGGDAIGVFVIENKDRRIQILLYRSLLQMLVGSHETIVEKVL